MKSIKIHDKAYVDGLGHRVHRNCKAVVIKELNLPFDSVAEAAEFLDVTGSTVSAALNGATKTAGGFHVFFAKEATENLDDLLEFNRSEMARRDAQLSEKERENAALREDAEKWRAFVAKQEAEKKAKEMEHERLRKAVSDSRETLDNLNNLIQHLDREMQNAVAAQMKAEQAEHDAIMALLKFEGKCE